MGPEPFARSDSISEDAEFQCDDLGIPNAISGIDKVPGVPGGVTSQSVSQSSSFLGKLEEPKEKRSRRRNIPRAASYDATPGLEEDEPRKSGVAAGEAVISPSLSRNDRIIPLDFSENLLKGSETGGEIDFGAPAIEGKGEALGGKLQVMTLGDLQDLNIMAQQQQQQQQKSDSAPHKHNIYDIKSQKKLQYVLRNGYSYKFHEKKHYNAYQKKPAKPEAPPAAKGKPQPSEMSLLAALKSITSFL